MNPSTDDWESQDIDRRLFDYLEGNLTREQALELEQEMASDATLAGALDHWKETVVTQDFYDTSLLEQKLLLDETIVPVQQTTNSITASLFVIALLTCICSLWPVKVENEAVNKPQAVVTHAPVAEKINNELTPPVSLLDKQGQQQVARPTQAKHIKPSTTAQKMIVYRTQTEILTKLRPVELPVSLSNEILIVTVPERGRKKLSLNSVPAARTVTRKQARQIARMKEKALQRRMANEFLKGNVPYVVPLNTRNF